MRTDLWSNLQIMRKTYAQAIEPVCQKWGLTRAEMDVLLFLSDGSGLDRAADIVECRGLTKSHVSVAVKELCAKGFLETFQDTADRRVVHLKVTAAARPVILDGNEVRSVNYAKLFAGLTDGEMEQWERLMEKIWRNVENMA